jgi:hypothetical protein
MRYAVMPIEISSDNVVSAPDQPVESTLVATDLETMEGLVACRGVAVGSILANRAEAETKFIEMTGRSSAPGELP